MLKLPFLQIAQHFYEVKPKTEIDTDFLPLVATLREKAVHTPRVLVYCQTLAQICMPILYYELGGGSYCPPGSPHVSDYRLLGMFHPHTPQHNKDVILKSLLVPDGVVCIVFATVALGMGINLRDVNTVLHSLTQQS